jgi:hypothetical protein
LKYKSQQKEFLERKLQMERKIEGLKREFNFIENLDVKDLGYILDKKREAAAIQI